MITVFQRIGPYDVIEEIGRGGMASVFLATDSRSERRVALKLVPLRDDREGREILEAERWGTKLQARLSEVCGLVPRVHEDCDLPPYYAIAMEYVDGENLSDTVGRGRLAPDEAIRVTRDLCRFLDVAHKFETTIDGHSFRALVHGDLKPRNVRLSATGEVKVLDFGIAKALSLSRKVTRNDFGSMPYLSPERLDSADVDAHADLWALGVILYELLSGIPPFHARDTRKLEQQIRSGYARRPLGDGCPVGLQAIVAHLLAPHIDERYATASAVLDDLNRFQTGQQTAAEARGWPGRVDEAPTQRTHAPQQTETEATRRTQPAAKPPVAEPRPPVATAPAAAAPARQARPRPLRTLLLIVALALVVNELTVGFVAGRAAASAMTRDLDGLAEVWTDYADLSERSYLRFGVAGLERVLRVRSQDLAEQVMANYRGPTPTVRERQWRAVQKNLQQAVVIAPGNEWLRAALRYCEGHLHRIDGEAEKARSRETAANQHFSEAVAAFREAAELRREWPDPFLGLARTFIYGLEDIDRAADAMGQAQRYGYSTGDRETAQLGDGYRARGDKLLQTATELADLPQESVYLQRASESFRQALTLYERIPGYAGVAVNIRRTRRALEQIERRISELAAGAVDGEVVRDPSTRPDEGARSGQVPSTRSDDAARPTPWA